MFTRSFDTPFFTGHDVTTDVPSRFPIGLAGHTYMLDMASDENGLRGQYFRRTSVPVLRTQADSSNVPNEGSVSPDDLWRRSQDTWHLGAGQSHLDRATSDPARFRSSKGVDVWTKWQATLLPDTQLALASSNNLRLVTAGPYTYLLDGTALKYTTDFAAFTTVTGTPSLTPTAITTDGYTVYVSYPDGLYTTTRGATSATAQGVTEGLTLLGYPKGRLMGASVNSLYNITQFDSNPDALFTHPNPDFTWVGFANGPSTIYAAGHSGGKSLIYRISVQADGTALDAPIVAGELPDGETIRSVLGYLDFLVIGSDAGVRLASSNSDGSLTIGGVIPVPAVQCLVAYSRFVWFGWTDYDSASTGLGRLDLANFTAPLTSAYASDLMATAQGTVGSVVIVAGQPVFAVDGVGAYSPTAAKVASGRIDSGLINYDLADPKVAMYLNLRTAPLPAGASVTSGLSPDSGGFTDVGVHNIPDATGPGTELVTGEVRAESFEIRQTLTRATDTTKGPSLTRHTLRCYPTPARSFDWVLPLVISEQLDPFGSTSIPMNVKDEKEYLFGLLDSLVTLQVASETFQVFIQDIDEVPLQLTADRSAFTATVVVHCKMPAG